jgi:hypothetical protein
MGAALRYSTVAAAGAAAMLGAVAATGLASGRAVRRDVTVKLGDVVHLKGLDTTCSFDRGYLGLPLAFSCERAPKEKSREIVVGKTKFFVTDEAGARAVYSAKRSP